MVMASAVSAFAALSFMCFASAQHSYADRDWSQEDWAIACEGRSEGASCEFVTNETTKCQDVNAELRLCWTADEIGAKRVSTCSFSTSRNIMGCFTDPTTYPTRMACAGKPLGSNCQTVWRGTYHHGQCYMHGSHGAYMCLEGPIGPEGDECAGKASGDQCDEEVGSYDREPSPFAVCNHYGTSGRLNCGEADSLPEGKYLPCIGRDQGAACGYYENELWNEGVCNLVSEGNMTCGHDLMSSAMKTLGGSAPALLMVVLALRV